MNRFAGLYAMLDRTRSTNAKIEAVADYFGEAAPGDAAWALFLLIGQRFKRLVGPAELQRLLAEHTGLPDWLVAECVADVGDLAEAVALLVDGEGVTVAEWQHDPAPRAGAHELGEMGLQAWVEREVQPLAGLPEHERAERVHAWWRTLDPETIFVTGKMLTGSLRVGVSKNLAAKALARHSTASVEEIQGRLMGTWEPSTAAFEALLAPAGERVGDRSQPYPFYLAHPLRDQPEGLGDRSRWLAEWKWDGIRAQLIKRDGEVHLWSRGEELITERFPELRELGLALPDGVVLDGEVLAVRDGRPLPFTDLQRRINRKKVGQKLLSEVPAQFKAFDLLERGGADLREAQLVERRGELEQLVTGLVADVADRLDLSPPVEGSSWSELAVARERSRSLGVEGLMLKRLDAPYRVGRVVGDWWKWKVDPLTVDVVLIHARAGSGKRANLFTDYTFGVWRGDELVPIARAYSGLTNDEIARLDRWIRDHTLERHGPVRTVEPSLVFELGFEAIARSRRHRSGLALRFPRILRQRPDKTPAEANRLEQVEELLDERGDVGP